MTTDEDYKQGSGKPGTAADDNTREGTKEDIRTKEEDDKAAPKTDTPDNLRDGTKA